MKFFKALFFLFIVLGTCKAFAQSSDELKKQRENLNQQLQRLNRDLEETSNNKKSTIRQLNIIKEQIEIRTKKIKNIDSDIRLLDNQISDNTNEVHSLQSQLVQLKKEYAAMVLFAFRNQSAYNKLMFIFVAKDFNQAYMRLKYLQQIGSYRVRQAEYITGTQKDLNHKIVELDKNKEQKTSLLVDQEKEKATLGKERNQQAQVVVDLSKHAKQVKQETAQTQRKLAAIDRAISAAIRREIEEARRREEARIAAEEKAAAAKAKADNKPVAPVVRKPAKSTNDYLTATPEAAKLSNDFLGNRGRLPWPVAAGNYIRRFGTVYINGIKDENQGVSIKTNEGAAVRAVFDGEVLIVQDVSGTYTVVIRHGGYFTAYSNLKSVSVSRGQKVSTKQSIGTAATDPATGNAEIEFEVLKGETYMDPAGWLAQN
ncbi:peptidoglycan DD-metalloendopeptidase family protein [Mucilaginibacter sp. HMF5004]|uniref:murein hydrolase activator EnvC family protein n=1 Tax=Mucilaginibacter rivuli TaxID=2857527 RepID=UPI001C5E0544|nr:peptidoglycan DD-metalloendopeptidase family protein [Mucilaginibacter rivuli]MBW4888689.1 peptidoglycan DD-metalloendopeptidase family protein [Mucilaginibacter rivuli]